MSALYSSPHGFSESLARQKALTLVGRCIPSVQCGPRCDRWSNRQRQPSGSSINDLFRQRSQRHTAHS